jgi:hypothetical protein
VCHAWVGFTLESISIHREGTQNGKPDFIEVVDSTSQQSDSCVNGRQDGVTMGGELFSLVDFEDEVVFKWGRVVTSGFS